MELWYVIRVDNEPSSAAQLKVNNTAGSGAGLMNTRRLQYFQRITGQGWLSIQCNIRLL